MLLTHREWKGKTNDFAMEWSVSHHLKWVIKASITSDRSHGYCTPGRWGEKGTSPPRCSSSKSNREKIPEKPQLRAVCKTQINIHQKYNVVKNEDWEIVTDWGWQRIRGDQMHRGVLDEIWDWKKGSSVKSAEIQIKPVI